MTFNGGRAICPNVTVMSLSTGERHSNDASLELIIGKNERNVGVLCPDVGVVFTVVSENDVSSARRASQK